ncbi:MAG: replication-associated recombination protein A [Candidatus Omnitrophica bacterium]|nr:replication-associated recombination protein A [Candidatus Omnitrophota bacterium]
MSPSRKTAIPGGSSDLFQTQADEQRAKHMPLAVRMRPRDLSEFVGQEKLIGPGKLLTRAIEADKLTSLILYGPPGCGKTCLGFLIAAKTKAHVERINAVASGVEDLRRAIEGAKARRSAQGKRTVLFIDEIHRFSKAQQDVLMPEMEDGTLILIGATTHNPFFSVVSPLLSRSLVAEFKPLSSEDLKTILRRAIADPRGLGAMNLRVEEEALEFLSTICDGDARRALNGLELAALTTSPDLQGVIRITRQAAEESMQKKAVVYDRDEDAHYDTISAYIKSMRGSDPDAALYWLAKMIYAGEDPRFIARRLVICAAEDVGNADPQALIIATAAAQSVEFIGLPECRIPLAQATIYVACAPKSNAAWSGIDRAMADVERATTLEVPTHLKDDNYSGAKKLGHGEGYKYAHHFPGHHVKQEYIPQKRRYYEPSDQGFEKELKTRLSKWRQP